MISERVWNRLFRRHGAQVALRDGDDRPKVYWALIHPLRYKNKMYLQGAYSDIGYVDPGFYLYIGPGAYPLDTLSRNATLTMGERSFVIDRAERVLYRGKSVYCWAVLRSMIQEDANEDV